jgi:hypothetical protein
MIMIPGWQMEACERIRAEIVKSAVRDLKKAMRKSDRLGCVCNEQMNLEKWFLSKWGQFLCEDRGEYIIDKCRKTYKYHAPESKKPSIPIETQQAIWDDYKNGVPSRDIFDKYGINTRQLHIILERWYK